MSVHPRVGGEQAFEPGSRLLPAGSSPRGRGTAYLAFNQVGIGRFIPAWAGNSTRLIDYRARRAVHPRVGGEQ